MSIIHSFLSQSLQSLSLMSIYRFTHKPLVSVRSLHACSSPSLARCLVAMATRAGTSFCTPLLLQTIQLSLSRLSHSVTEAGGSADARIARKPQARQPASTSTTSRAGDSPSLTSITTSAPHPIAKQHVFTSVSMLHARLSQALPVCAQRYLS